MTAWEASVPKEKRFEYRQWGDNEPLYTILMPDGSYNKNSMYRLNVDNGRPANTVVTLVLEGIDPLTGYVPNTQDMWDEIKASDKPIYTFLDKMDVYEALAQRPQEDPVLYELEFQNGLVLGEEKYNAYKAGDAGVTSDVKNVLPLFIANVEASDVKQQTDLLLPVFEKHIGKVLATAKFLPLDQLPLRKGAKLLK